MSVQQFQDRQALLFFTLIIKDSGLIHVFSMQAIGIICLIREIIKILFDCHEQARNTLGASKL